MAMCPGPTDTTIFTDVHRRPLREEWGDEVKRQHSTYEKQK